MLVAELDKLLVVDSWRYVERFASAKQDAFTVKEGSAGIFYLDCSLFIGDRRGVNNYKKQTKLRGYEFKKISLAKNFLADIK